MNKTNEKLVNFLFPAARGGARRKDVRQTVRGVIAGIIIAVAFGLILYLLNRQNRF